MLPCITCTKHVVDNEEDDEEEEKNSASSISSSKVPEAKSLASQLKYVVLKISSGYKQCRPCANFRGDSHSNLTEDLYLGTTTSDASSSEDWNHGNHTKQQNQNQNQQQNQHQQQHSQGSIGKAAAAGGGGAASSPTSSSQLSSSSCSVRNSIGGGSGSSTTKVEAEDTRQEWVAQIEPGVLITFLALPNGENELKRIRFSRELFNKWQAESWWSENWERVHELYNIAGRDHSFPNSRKEVPSSQVRVRTNVDEEQQLKSIEHDKSLQAAASSSEEVNEWVEEDEPGVYITVKIGANGRELKRVRFSREKFSEKQAKLWWEKNRFRIHDQYL